jgi:hypothetical protein
MNLNISTSKLESSLKLGAGDLELSSSVTSVSELCVLCDPCPGSFAVKPPA